jgi:hypothetical protein
VEIDHLNRSPDDRIVLQPSPTAEQKSAKAAIIELPGPNEVDMQAEREKSVSKSPYERSMTDQNLEVVVEPKEGDVRMVNHEAESTQNPRDGHDESKDLGYLYTVSRPVRRY